MTDMNGNYQKKLSEIDVTGIAYPKWIDNDHMLMQTRTDLTGKDTEIFIINKSGNKEIVTSNSTDEFFPTMINNTIYYGVSNPNSPSTLNYSKKEFNRWTEHSTGLSGGNAFIISGNNIVYYDDDMDLMTRRFFPSIGNPINLSEVIRTKYLNQDSRTQFQNQSQNQPTLAPTPNLNPTPAQPQTNYRAYEPPRPAPAPAP